MSLDDAIAGRAGHADLAKFVSTSWLRAQAARNRHDRHPLYDWLEAPPDHADADAVIGALDSACASGIGDVRSRGRRLTADFSDYWSAMSELYLAAALRDAGLAARLGNPDVLVTENAESVAIEINAVQETGDAARLTAMLTASWDGELQGVIEIPDETVRITRRESEAIVELMIDAERMHRGTGRAWRRYETGQAVEVDLSPVVSRDRVRGYLDAGDPAFFITRSGVRTNIRDPWPGLEERVRQKRRQLRDWPCAVVAVEYGHGHTSAYGWADRVAAGWDSPTLETDSNIAGLLVYWLDVRLHRPSRGIFIWNGHWGHQCALFDRVLTALGAKQAGPPPTRPSPAS